MDDAEAARNRFHVGPIYVEVRYDMGTPAACTIDGGIGDVDLGAEIVVRLSEYEFEGADEPDQPYGSVGMWRMLLTRMRDVLASFMLLGEMRPAWDGSAEDEGYGEFGQAVDELGERFFKVTPEVAVEAIRRRAREAEAGAQGLAALGEFMQAQQARPDEDITLGEAKRRQEEGVEEVRGIVERGDEE